MVQKLMVVGSLLLIAQGIVSCGDGEPAGGAADERGVDDSASSDAGSSGGGPATGTPADPICVSGCKATIAAACKIGPPTQEWCEADCTELSEGSCGSEYGVFQNCSKGKAISCGGSGFPVVVGCEREQAAFIACLNAR